MTDMPARIAKLPRWRIMAQDFPVPWFVQWMKDGEPCPVGEGEPDFRVIDRDKLMLALRKNLCWVCGEKLGRYLAFTIGPMCTINRTTAEPGSHLECATWSACNCPFLTRPRMRRNTKDLPEHNDPPGEFLTRNPGVACVWVTETVMPFSVHGGYPLLSLGDPLSVTWYCEGRPARREEIAQSIETGYPLLMKMAEEDGPDAVAELEVLRHRAMQYVEAVPA